VNWLDILLAVIIVGCIIEGFAKGLARTGLGFVATVLGLFCGLWFYGVVGAFFIGLVHSKELANLIGFLVIVAAIVFIGFLLSLLIEHLIKMASLGWLNRVLGGVFGFLRGVLVAAVIVLAMMAFSEKPPPQSVANSQVAPYVIDTARMLVAAAPQEMKNAFVNSYDRIKQIWADTLKHGIRKLPEQHN
jgi:membrane protein required for colicin V production